MAVNSFKNDKENVENCVRSLLLACPVLSIEAAKGLLNKALATPEKWVDWRERFPTQADAPIVGIDCLGYIHMATHLIGGRDPTDGMWVERWLTVRL